MSAPFDFGDGKVQHDGWEIAEDIPLENQIDVLREDLVQVSYGERITLDIGWHEVLRTFLLYLVKDADWDNPVYRGEFKTIGELKEAVRNIVPTVMELSRNRRDGPGCGGLHAGLASVGDKVEVNFILTAPH